jgi:hypothetical protein
MSWEWDNSIKKNLILKDEIKKKKLIEKEEKREKKKEANHYSNE